MAENVNISCGRVYQHNEKRNGDSSIRSPHNLKIDIILNRPRESGWIPSYQEAVLSAVGDPRPPVSLPRFPYVSRYLNIAQRGHVRRILPTSSGSCRHRIIQNPGFDSRH